MKQKKIQMYRNGIYPMKLYVARMDDMDTVQKSFYFYNTVENMANLNTIDFGEPPTASNAVTVLVSDKRTDEYGVLILLNNLNDLSYQKLVDVISHEASHAANGINEYLGMSVPSYDHGDEHYAYLLGWIAGCIMDSFLIFRKYEDETDTE